MRKSDQFGGNDKISTTRAAAGVFSRLGLCSLLLFAQPEIAIAGNPDALIQLFGGIVEQGVRAQQQKRQNDAQRQERNRQQQQRRQEQQRQRAEEAQFIKEIQKSLAQLGFYDKAIDGDYGPGTRAAVGAFKQAFGLRRGEFTADQIAILHALAKAGFRSLEEYRAAESAGFATADDYRRAAEGGFEDGDSYAEAVSYGFTHRKAFEQFRKSGFSDKNTFERATKGGFSNAAEFRAATDAGFDQRKDYLAFVASGYANRDAYFEAKGREEARLEQAKACLPAMEAKDWLVAAEACHAGVLAAPKNRDFVAAYAESARQIRLEIENGEARLSKLETEIAEAAGKDKGVRDALIADVAKVETGLNRAKSAVALIECSDAFRGRFWNDAVIHCNAAAQARPDDKDVKLWLANAEKEKATADKTAAKEKTRLALEEANEKAQATIEALEAYSRSGNTMSRGVEVARAIVEVRSAVEAANPAAIERARLNLEDLVASDKAYVEFTRARIDAQKAASASAALAAQENAARAQAFIQDYVARNIASPHIEVLLSADKQIGDALASADIDTITNAQKNVLELLESIDLAEEAERFQLQPAEEAERLQKAVASAETHRLAVETTETQAGRLLADIKAYSEKGGRFEKGFDVARLAATLQRSSDTAEMAETLGSLQDIVSADWAFAEFQRGLELKTAAARNDAIAIARSYLQALLTVVEDFASQNPLDQNLPDLLDLHDAVSSVLDGGEGDELIVAAAKGKEVLAVNDLWRDVEKRVADNKEKTEVKTVDNGLAITPANRFLLEGEGGDLLLLRNTQSDAPYVRTNILGEVVFTDKFAEFCWFYGGRKDWARQRQAISGLFAFGLVEATYEGGCNINSLGVDVVAFSRSDLLTAAPEEAKQLITAYEEHKLQKLAVIPAAQVEAAVAEENKFIDEIADAVRHEARTGVGLIQLDEIANRLCVVEGENTESVEYRLRNNSGADRYFLHADGFSNYGDIEKAFGRLKGGECDSVLAEAKDLKLIDAALEREGIRREFAPYWAGSDDLEAAVRAFAQSKAETAEKTAETRQKEEFEARLRSENAKAEEERRKGEEIALQAKYGQEARAGLKELQALVAPALWGNNDGPFDDFETFVTLRRDRDWTLELADGELVDYGQAAWKDRRLEAVAGRFMVKAKNKILGEIKDHCFIFAVMIDAEFEQFRDALYLPCDDSEGGLDDWRRGRRFESRWIVARR